MAVHVNIHMTHRQYTDGKNRVDVEGKTVGECLKHLTEQFPGMQNALFDKNGKLLRVVEVLINDTPAFPRELSKTVSDGDELHLLVMLAGG